MTAKPVVALVLPLRIAEQMFRERDLQRLSDRAEVRGPFAEESARDAALGDAEAVITGWGSPRFDEALLARSPRLKLVAHSAGSVKPIVNPATYARGIRVSSAAAVNATPVAEFTVAAMVMMLKRFPWCATAYTTGSRRDEITVYNELRDIEIGLVGASRVGREVIRLLKAYPDLTIKLYDPYLPAASAEALGVQLSSLEEVCRCQVVSIHAPDIPETHHMFNARTLALLPDHGVLINTARGRLIDEAALVDEVRRRPLYVLLDVTHPEPPAPDSPLRNHPNILLTPHIAGAMNQARRDMGKLAIDETLRFLSGEPLQHEVTLAMLPTQA